MDTQRTVPALARDENGLYLEKDGLILRADFSKLLKRIKPSNLNGEMIVRAAKIKGESAGLRVVDATAGFGEDSFLLAAAGFSVLMFERDKVIAALLGDALESARKNPELSSIAQRMTFCEGDSIKELPSLGYRPDVIVLDPMFPARRKSSMIKKKLQFIQLLELPCGDEVELMRAALSAEPRRIIVKRPASGAFLAGVKPDYSITGNSIRYDCIAVRT